MARTTTVSVGLKDLTNQNGSLSYTFDRGWLAALADFLNWPNTKADALKDLAETYSNAKAVRSGIANATIYTLPAGFIDGPDIDKGFDTCDQKAVLSFRETATGAARQMTIPAPKSSMFERKVDQGYRVIQATGDAIAASLTTILGIDLVFVSGYLDGQK